MASDFGHQLREAKLIPTPGMGRDAAGRPGHCGSWWRPWVLALLLVLTLPGCSQFEFFAQSTKPGDDPTRGGIYKIGDPYEVGGVWYYPHEDYDYDETGIASWYGPGFHGKRTANGEYFDMNDITIAHRTLPMPSIVRVTNLENGRSIKARVNDRGPFARGRVIDLSRRAAELLDCKANGTAKVRVQIDADESRALAMLYNSNQTLAANRATPITVERMPKADVSSETLAPPPGAKAASEPAPTLRASLAQPASTKPVKEKALNGTARHGNELAVKPLKDETVTQTPVQPTGIFIQAGAFAEFVNADRVRASLQRVGQVRIAQTLVKGRDIFRVRLGPIANVEEADRLLEKVARIGYPEARIIVD